MIQRDHRLEDEKAAVRVGFIDVLAGKEYIKEEM